MIKNKPQWLRSKGYLHINPQLDIYKRSDDILRKIEDSAYVARYAFYPLIHTILTERRYKYVDANKSKRAHSFTDSKGIHVKNFKSRPIHYATHMDAMIFGYYAEILQRLYEKEISNFSGLHDCVIAYRKIPTGKEDLNKSTIHFAHELFEEIKKRSENDHECAVLTFDIKGFFPSLDHNILKSAWTKLIQADKLPNDHYNVFKATTRFSYIMLDDLRKNASEFGSFEKHLAKIRNGIGIQSFFGSPRSFREKIKNGAFQLHKYPFRNKAKEPIGIPQGLPISAILANLYLLDFDLKVLKKIVGEMGAYYKRYSDDIAVVCSVSQMKEIDFLINQYIKESLLDVSADKTEKFVFKKMSFGNKNARLTSIKQLLSSQQVGAPMLYLGFDFNGKNALIKSSNLAKFYRRMIFSVKRKAKRAKNIANSNNDENVIIFRRQLYKLYSALPLGKIKSHSRIKRLVKNDFGAYRILSTKKVKSIRGNYFTYVRRASEIMNEPLILRQVKNHRKIFNQAILKYLKTKRH